MLRPNCCQTRIILGGIAEHSTTTSTAGSNGASSPKIHRRECITATSARVYDAATCSGARREDYPNEQHKNNALDRQRCRRGANAGVGHSTEGFSKQNLAVCAVLVLRHSVDHVFVGSFACKRVRDKCNDVTGCHQKVKIGGSVPRAVSKVRHLFI